MQFRRSFFFALLVAVAIPALAADKGSSPAQPLFPGRTEATLTRGPYAQQFLARAGLLSTPGETRVDLGPTWVPGSRSSLSNDAVCYTAPLHVDLGHPWVPGSTPVNDGVCYPVRMYPELGHPWAAGTTVLNDHVCYTMRTYKVKPTERLAGGESASRGYSTCELASNFQIRAIVAPTETAGAPPAQSQQK